MLQVANSYPKLLKAEIGRVGNALDPLPAVQFVYMLSERGNNQHERLHASLLIKEVFQACDFWGPLARSMRPIHRARLHKWRVHGCGLRASC